ncbi:MAG: hypothetical protein IJS90_01120 [Clostridia bacterium]|nr:hypothetical protein [Clostridia bacterium]
MEQNIEKNEKPDEGKRKYNAGNIIIGLIAVLLAGFGVYSLIDLGVDYIKDAKSRKQLETYEEYYRFIIPAAAIDIEPFEDVTYAKMTELVEMSVWAVLNSGLDPALYEYTSDSLLLPEDQVEAAFISFFGTEISIYHCTVEGYGYEFVYNATDKVYEIPLTTITPIYTPVITDSETKAGTTSVTVGLLNSGLYSQNSVTGELTPPGPDKYIKVTFRTSTTGRYISSVRTSSTPETASAEVTYETAAPTETQTKPQEALESSENGPSEDETSEN